MSRPTPSLTLALLQAREAAMGYFRPLLNEHGLTEQQWRVIRILKQSPEATLESRELAEQACILRPSLTGVLVRLERDGYVRRWKPEHDQRRLCVTLTEQGHALFDAMSIGMIRQYQKIQQQLGAENFTDLMALLRRLRQLEP
ncbi:homoprotocatechuate degradation operon regulator HpaR [Halomonas sp. M5N1S17]|uniref:homoprotocatechuate degradation operon regulator HpaR n=1 Tax=Halomonas alkalisoli TaxID=2907158 RepID=UPI001F47F6DE|nr:homoprotocatechuate degradation operon regulator HpaR [Halomonas alkalisoli]MCE9664707.1 homoprotocatechuate degradation operon regulator HpaR [Halomonas alkalisoli]